jgi:hypothetical protein
MKLSSTIKLASLCAACVVLAGCETTAEQAPPTAVRTRAPQAYEKAITNYLAFRIRGPQNNAEINIGTPEPSNCALDEFVNSSRGWVVPVAHATRTGVPSGKETINIVTRQYFFWFRGDTISGLTSRIDSCPGATVTEFPQPAPVADLAAAGAAAPAQARAETSGRDAAAAPEAAKAGRPQDGAKSGGAQKSASPNKTRKPSPSATGAPKPVKKPDASPGTT